MIKKLIFIVIFIFCFSVSVSAETEAQNDFYKQQYDLSGAEELNNYLPDETRDFMKENEIIPEADILGDAASAENVFTHIWGFLTSGAKKPLLSGTGILAIILISAAIDGWSTNASALSTQYATAISAVAVIAAPVTAVITAAVSAMKGCTVFMTAFIPIFAGVTAASGSAATSVSMSSLLLGASEAVSFIANFIVIPLMSGYLAITIATSISPVISKTGIADGIKKLAFWIMSLTSTIFIGILSIQTALNSAADNLGTRTAKFIIGSAVPIAGTALSEALTTVTSAMGTLRATIGIYGVIACLAIFLPLLAELFLWRIMLNLTSGASELFSQGKISSLLRSIDSVMSVLMGIILLTLAVFIISLTIVVGSAK